jgi:serine/threonine protein kinase
VSAARRGAIVGRVGGQLAEQIIAGIVLSERLAVTMYGAIHRAQWSGQRNMRGLVLDAKLLEENDFRGALTGPAVDAAIALDRATIVPIIAVETNGPDVVIVTRGVGRYVTVQDLIHAARANRSAGGKLSQPVAAAIGRAVVEALAAAHSAGVVHGAVHPRSVLVDEDGGVRLGDFVVGRALATAAARGADASLWRGLGGFLAPELAVGEDPSMASDVFAVGALLFTMLAGEVPPGPLHTTPAMERLIHRALDTDLVRRYRSAVDLCENLLEAFEDDRWELADRGEVIRAAGLSQAGDNIDDATEDLLASLGNSAVQVTPMRPSVDTRAEVVAARHHHATPTAANRLDALLADLHEDGREPTSVEEMAGLHRDPISELIQMDPRKREAIVQVRPRVPSLDDPDDDTPLPPPQPDPELDLPRASSGGLATSAAGPTAAARDEAAALDALLGLDEPVRRVTSAADQAAQAAARLEQAAQRAEAAAARVEPAALARPTSAPAAASAAAAPPPIASPAARAAARPIAVEEIAAFDVPAPRLRSRATGVVLLLALVGTAGGFYFIYQSQREQTAEERARQAARRRQAEEQTRLATAAQADAGAISISSTPSQAGVWLRLGRTPVTTMQLPAASTHELALLLDGHQLAEVQVMATHWSAVERASGGAAEAAAPRRTAAVRAVLVPLAAAPAAPPAARRPPIGAAAQLPLQPTALHVATGISGEGPISVSSSPDNAEAFLFVGLTGSMRFDRLTAGRDYELVVVKDGYKPRHVTIKADEWRDGGDPTVPIDAARKRSMIERAVELEPLPDAGSAKQPGGKRR